MPPPFRYTPLNAFARQEPLGPGTVNQLQVNAEAIDELARAEHFSDGEHNAQEIPWVLGHMVDGSPPTGHLFDTAYGGGTLARPATGEYTLNVTSGFIPTDASGKFLSSVLANVCGSGIEAKPHLITTETVSATSVRLRVEWLTSALGSGDAWAAVNRNVDVAVHAPAQPHSTSLLLSRTLKRRRDWLTEAATDWSALAQNQGIIRKASLLEHTAAGAHNVNRIAKAVGFFTYAPTAYTRVWADGVASVSRVSLGVIDVFMDGNFTSLNTMACFPEVQPATPNELCVINGAGFGTGAGTSKFRFYIYAFDGTNWARADRTFSAAMFGVTA
jgi:hypothetical protein